jgi:hypothetical protein
MKLKLNETSLYFCYFDISNYLTQSKRMKIWTQCQTRLIFFDNTMYL